MAGKDEDYRGVVVLPFIATVARQPPDSPSAQLIQELFDDLIDRSVQLPGLVRTRPLIPLLRVCLPKGVARGPRFQVVVVVGRAPPRPATPSTLVTPRPPPRPTARRSWWWAAWT